MNELSPTALEANDIPPQHDDMPAERDVMPAEREQTPSEEVANAVTHGVGAILSVACLAVAVAFAAVRKDAWDIVSLSIYGASMFILYLSSTLYHAIPTPRVKAVLNIFDHAAIYLLIAGTYTPFCLSGMRHCSPGWAWSIFGVVWAVAIFGIVFQALFVSKYPRFSTATYLLMGWIVLVAVYPLWKAMGTTAVIWIAVGGVLYSLGVVFYAMKNVRYMHAIWHLFVLGGTLVHYGVILYYIALGLGK
ncbi:MAG: PAQR family membrane homeostasis protein TrhA [Kiritimatiellia bacterium]|jgi:hemolysin III